VGIETIGAWTQVEFEKHLFSSNWINLKDLRKSKSISY
jgi:hypothetical protein